MFEALMLLCFGVSWPASIIKTWRSRQTAGKSPLFLWLVFIGYLSGLIHKFTHGTDWVTVLYAINGTMVMTDIVLYYRFSRKATAA